MTNKELIDKEILTKLYDDVYNYRFTIDLKIKEEDIIKNAIAFIGYYEHNEGIVPPIIEIITLPRILNLIREQQLYGGFYFNVSKYYDEAKLNHPDLCKKVTKNILSELSKVKEKLIKNERPR